MCNSISYHIYSEGGRVHCVILSAIVFTLRGGRVHCVIVSAITFTLRVAGFTE